MAEGALQRPQPGLEVAPLLETFLENGSANLLRAGGAHAALGLIVLDTGRLELEAAKIEYATHARLEVLDHVFVPNLQDFARMYRVPMVHQLDVHPIIAG